jgi:serine/threonine protein kinase
MFNRGDIINQRYIVDCVLNQSLFGAVYKVQIAESTKFACIKVSNLQLSQSLRTCKQAQTLENIQSECNILKHLLEKGSSELLQYICGFIEEFSTHQYHFLVTEYAGLDLYDWMSLVKRPLTDEECLPIFQQIVNGVQLLHQHNVVHCDLSLENICIDPVSMKIKFIDFGIAEIIHSDDNGAYPAKPNTIPKGKERYVSPECWNRQGYNLFCNDIYALGVVLFGLLANRGMYDTPDGSDERFKQYITGKWKFTSIHTKTLQVTLSIAAIQLIDTIIKPECDRPNCAQILQHLWFQRNNNDISSSNNNDIIVPVKSYTPPPQSQNPPLMISKKRRHHSNNQVVVANNNVKQPIVLKLPDFILNKAHKLESHGGGMAMALSKPNFTDNSPKEIFISPFIFAS